MQAAVDTIEQAEGAVGVLINNAGYSQSGAIETVPLDAVRRQFETNVFGLVRLTQLVLPKMRAQRWGKIVNVGSMGGRLSFPGGGHYHATKHALEAISDALRFELRGFGIDVVLLEPGLITTEFGEAATASMADVDDRRRRSLREFNATVGAVTKGAYDGPMRAARRRPRSRREGDRARAQAPPPAGAHHDHAVGQDHDRDAPPAARPRLGRRDARAVPAAATDVARRSARQHGLRSADLRSPARSRRRSSRSMLTASPGRRRTRRSCAGPSRARGRRAP